MPDCPVILPNASPFRRYWLPTIALVGTLVLCGCQPEPKIRKYTVPKLAVASESSQTQPTSAQPRAMLGAIVLAGSDAWFFKATATPDVIAEQRDAITKFLRGTTFSGSGDPPRWQLLEGWKEGPGDSIRFATIRIGSSSPTLELTVTRLPRGDDDAAAILQNVNRWRGQVSLPPTTSETIEKEAEQFNIGEFPCTLVELVGTGSGTMGGPFSGGPSAGGLPGDHPPVGADGTQPRRSGGGANLTYAVPEGWNELPAGDIRQASFEIQENGQKADISVTDLSLRAPNAGDIAANVNRWRGLVGLPNVSADEVSQSVRRVEGQGVTWQVVQVVGKDQSGDPQTILGAMCTRAESAWFVKLTAPSQLAQREQQRFEQFVKSLKIESQ